MFSVVQRMVSLERMDNTIGPRDLDDCKKATRVWTSEGWVKNPAKLAECNSLRDQRDFNHSLEQGLAEMNA